MRNTVLVSFILLGSVVGMFFALNETVALKIFQSGIGAVVGAAVGGAIAGIGRRRHRPSSCRDEADGFRAAQDKQTRNYWLDRGRVTAAPSLPHPDDSDPHSHES